jgi:four helix bundle protein
LNFGIVSFGHSVTSRLAVSQSRALEGLDGTKSAYSRGMREQAEILKRRTLDFAVMVLGLVDRLPQTAAGQTIARQLAKSSTSVAANYRAGCNARSRAEFIAKLCIVVEEADESAFWLEVINRTEYLAVSEVASAKQEAAELRAIFSRSVGTARSNQRQ